MAPLPPKKLYKIGEVIRYSGLSRQTIHNYTMMGFISPEERTSTGGHRLYPESTFERLEKIKRWRRHRPLAEVLEMLRRDDEEAARRGRPSEGAREMHRAAHEAGKKAKK